MKAAAVLLALPALLAGCLAGEPAAPDVATGQIDGAVVDHLLNPFPDQPVFLVQLDRVDRTSTLGGFTFREVPVGIYTLTTSRDGGQADAEVVEVRAGEITRIILQLMPIEGVLPHFEAFSFRSPGEIPQANEVCESCEWAIPLRADRPAEVTFEAMWDSGPGLPEPVGEGDHLHILITDGRGFQLYNGKDKASPLLVSIAGEDIHPEATELRVTVSYAPGFLPSTQDFSMDSVLTLYYGATKLQMFSVPA